MNGINDLFLQYGAVGLIAFWLYQKLNKAEGKIDENDKLNREAIKEQKIEIKELRKENKDDKEMFKAAIESFNKTVNNFTSVKDDLNCIKDKVVNMEEDIKEIKDTKYKKEVR